MGAGNKIIRILFIVILLFIFQNGAKAGGAINNRKQDNSISISNTGKYSKTVIIYLLSESDSTDKWVRIGSYYLQSGHTIGFTIESLGNITNYAFRVQGESAGITRFSKNHMKFE